MPLHRIYAPASFFTDEEKRELANVLTSHYTTIGLAPFLVNTLFISVESQDFFIGNQTHQERASEKGKSFVRIVSQHLARTMEGKEMREMGINRLEATFRKVLDKKNCEWEIHIEEPPADLWRLSGHTYPAPKTQAEAQWREKNEPTEYQGPSMADYLESKKSAL